MIFVTRLDKQEMYLNPDHIISIEETPDTVIALFNGHHFIVKERARVIIDRIIAFKSRIIRRSNNRLASKAQSRSKQSFFGTSTLNREHGHTDEQSDQTRSPFHYREN